MRKSLILSSVLIVFASTCNSSDAQITRTPEGSLLPKRTRTVTEAPKEEANIRLTYWETPWSKVFRDVAQLSGSELVMDRIPNGNFNRADRNVYTRSDAVKILNRYLERLNFRMFEQGKYLIVMPHQVARSRYGRPVIRPEEVAAQVPVSRQPERHTYQQPQRRVDTIRPGVARQATTYQQYGNETNRREATSSQFTSGNVATAQYYMRDSQSGMVRLSSNEAGTKKVGKPDLKEAVVVPKNLPAVEIARSIYKAFNKHAKLVDVGPGGFPGVTISWPQKFDLGIDTKTNRLFVSGEGSQVQGAVKMIQLLDRPVKLDEKTELVPADQETSKIALNLQPTIKKLVTQPGLPPVPAPVPKTQPEPPSAAMLGGLKGDVSIQNVPGIGLVVTGNEEDVKKVMQVIRQIEQLSVGTNPDIHLALLTNVDSTALSELLTTVYEKLAAVQNPQARASTTAAATVAIVPVVKPNAVLIIAPTAALESLLALIEKLDRPVDPRTEFAVYHLRSAVASQVVSMLQQFYQERGGLGVRVVAYADSRTNSVVVQAQPRDMQEVAALVAKIDRDTTAAVNQMKIYPLKNAVAEELVEVLNEAIRSVLNPPTTGQGGGGQGSQALREAKSAVLQFLTIDRKEGRQVRSGILADIRITADMRTNSLVVTAPGKSMALIGALIEQLDKPTANVAEIKVFSLENADATTVVGLLENLFVQTAGGQQSQTGIQVVGAEGASSSLIPLRFSVDVRTNSIIAVGGAEALQVVEAILFRLDENEIRQREKSGLPTQERSRSRCGCRD